MPGRRPGDVLSPQSAHLSPGVQLTGGNRQVRTTVPPLARGGTPVIAGSWSLASGDARSDPGRRVSQPVARALQGPSRSGTNRFFGSVCHITLRENVLSQATTVYTLCIMW
jgi:hypothetical protein